MNVAGMGTTCAPNKPAKTSKLNLVRFFLFAGLILVVFRSRKMVFDLESKGNTDVRRKSHVRIHQKLF